VAAQTRDGARFIGPARDADVLAALAKKGGRTHDGGPTPEERARDAALAAKYLRGARQLAFRLPYEDLTDGVLVRRITRTWRRSRHELQKAVEAPSAERLHEWRKAVKRLLYQATLLAGHHPGLTAQIEILDELQERLGDHHDLHALLGLMSLPGREVDLAELEERALTQGGLVLSAEPEAFSAWLAADHA
jgi:CHAD domain-containing protein